MVGALRNFIETFHLLLPSSIIPEGQFKSYERTTLFFMAVTVGRLTLEVLIMSGDERPWPTPKRGRMPLQGLGDWGGEVGGLMSVAGTPSDASPTLSPLALGAETS